MCIQCSKCSAQFYCKTNTIMVDNHVIHPWPSRECQVDFHFVANCRCCWCLIIRISTWWLMVRWSGLAMEGLQMVAWGCCPYGSHPNKCFICLKMLFWKMMKNENQQNLLHSSRIGARTQKKTQSIWDSYQGLEKISWSRWIIICFGCNNTPINGCFNIKIRYWCYFEEITSSYPCEVVLFVPKSLWEVLQMDDP